MEEEATREKMPTQAQEYVLRISEILSQIQKKIKPILRDFPSEAKSPEKALASQLLLALKEIVEKAEYLRDSIDL